MNADRPHTAGPGNTAPVPDRIRLGGGRTRLTLHWADGLEAVIPAVQLRRACRCSGCEDLQRVGLRPAVDADLSIPDLKQFGVAGLNPIFSDGHGRGIYPWAYLREIALGLRTESTRGDPEDLVLAR